MQRLTFRTPGGNEAIIHCRPGTNDAMTAEMDIVQDRYGIAEMTHHGGLHIDIGAHIGTWMVAALLDDPAAEAIAVEPLPANVEAIAQNVAENGLSDRVRIIHTAAFARRGGIVPVVWDFRSVSDPDVGRMHRYIGGFSLAGMPDDVTYKTHRASAITPAKLLTEDVAVLKVAGETSEQALIGAKGLEHCRLILGKYHSELPKLVPWLRKTHRVETSGAPDFGWYHATLR